MLNNRLKRIHRSNCVAACKFNIVISKFNIFVAVFLKGLLAEFLSRKIIMAVRITDGNAPSAYIFNETTVYRNAVIPCNACLFLICRSKAGHIYSAVIHMLVVNISVYIMDIEIIQSNRMNGASVLSDCGNARSVRFIGSGISLNIFELCFIADFYIVNNNILSIVKKHRRRNIALIHMVLKIEHRAVVLKPQPRTVCGNVRHIFVFAVCTDFDRLAVNIACIFDMQKLIFKNRTVFEQDLIPCTERNRIDFIKSQKSGLFR